MDTPSTASPSIGGPGNGAAAGNSQKMVDRMAQTAHETVDRVAAAAGPAMEKLRTSATTAKDTLQARADQFGALEEQWLASARGYVREHPFTAVAIGVVAGLVIGRIVRSSD